MCDKFIKHQRISGLAGDIGELFAQNAVLPPPKTNRLHALCIIIISK